MDLEQLTHNILELKQKYQKRIKGILELGQKSQKKNEDITTEETTKMSLINPFIRALGYDTEDPTEVVAEFTADVGTKKGEKVDFAIKKDNKVIIVIEAKSVNINLGDVHANQLDRYFNCLDCRFGILTNGVDYHFYSDLDKVNRMDKHPFFTFNIFSYEGKDLKELVKFASQNFDEQNISSQADKLKYVRSLKNYLQKNLQDPSRDFFKSIFSQVYDGNCSSKIFERYSQSLVEAYQQLISDELNKKLKTAFPDSDIRSHQTNEVEIEEEQVLDPTFDKEILYKNDEKGITTTIEEVEAYHIIKSILRNDVDVARVIMKDAKSYCAILFDNIKNKKPIARLYNFDLSQKQKVIGIFDANKQETKFSIDTLEDIYNYSEYLIKVVKTYSCVKNAENRLC